MALGKGESVMFVYKSNMKTIHNLILFAVILVMTCLLVACLNSEKTNNGISFIASRGAAPPAQSIVWSPTDEDLILVTAYETPAEPTRIYVLEIKTKMENVIIEQLPANLLEARWTPDGKYALVLSGGDTPGFDAPGWWKVDLHNKTSEPILNLVDAAWSPDGNIVMALEEEKEGVATTAVHLVLISLETANEQIISTFDQADSSSGLSWSPDGQYLVFSLGIYGYHDLYIFNMKTRQVEKLTETNGVAHPVWSPAGNIIAFEKYPTIYLLDVDRRCEVEIPDLENVWSPTWSPDGRRLGYIGRDGIFYLETDKVLERNIYQSLCD